jgi:hypothetical protein
VMLDMPVGVLVLQIAVHRHGSSFRAPPVKAHEA